MNIKNCITPPKLAPGDTVRIIAPSQSMRTKNVLGSMDQYASEKRLESLGLKISYGKHVFESDEFGSTAIEQRIEDLHDAFTDPEVKMILPWRGGWNVNQLLKYIDYDLIRKNPKIIGGFSDITALSNAIFAKTGLVTYSTPSFSSFHKADPFDYSLNSFQQCLMNGDAYQISPSRAWHDLYHHDENNRTHENEGYWVLNPGEAQGTLLGGNQCTFNLLHGTEFMPDLENSILFLEDDFESHRLTIDRDLQSIIHQPGFIGVKGIVFGRFPIQTEMERGLLAKIVKSKPELKSLPIIAHVDFGHTFPCCSFPIGGTVSIQATENDQCSIKILQH